MLINKIVILKQENITSFSFVFLPEIILSFFFFRERLKIRPGENIDLVPQELLRKYIAYVRKYVPSPKLSEKAGQILQKFYLELRMQHRDKESTPVTTRQLESMIRLTEVIWFTLCFFVLFFFSIYFHLIKLFLTH